MRFALVLQLFLEIVYHVLMCSCHRLTLDHSGAKLCILRVLRFGREGIKSLCMIAHHLVDILLVEISTR